MSQTINADQVCWMLGAITRYLPQTDGPRTSRARELQSHALLYELMELAGLVFEDDAAAGNATPRDVRVLRLKGSVAGITRSQEQINRPVCGHLMGSLAGAAAARGHEAS